MRVVAHLPQQLAAAGEAPAELLLIGVDHKTAPITLREQLAYGSDDAAALLAELRGEPSIAELCLLSTCNRTELYLCGRDQPAAYRTAFKRVFLRRAPAIEEEGRFYVKRGSEAARHLLAVAAGLESMVLGEPEILGQVRQAAVQAASCGASGALLDHLLRQAIAAGGRARRETAIGAGAVSFGYAVVELAHTIFQRLEDCAVLVVGAGETAQLVARSLVERGARELRVSNRGERRLAEFRQLFPQAVTVPFARRYDGVRGADVVVATTAAAEPVLDRDGLAEAMAERRGRPLLVVDLGLPRNVEERARELENLFLEDIDALEGLIARNLKRRRAEVPRVQEIVDQELDRFLAWHRARQAEPLIAQLQRRAEDIRRREVQSALRRIPAEHHEALERLTRALVRKILHHPSQYLRAAGEDERIAAIAVLRRLFDLREDGGG